MLYDARRQRAKPGERSTCPACGQVLIAKCGEIVIWHWAHLTADCDPWSEPESQWHLDWKERLEARGAQVEVAMGEHRADVVLPDGRILELQNGYQDVAKIKAREAFYGPHMMWLYRCRWHERIHWGERGFWWKQGSTSMVHHERPLYWDMGQDIARVNINQVRQEDWSMRILGRFVGLAPHTYVINRWTRPISVQTSMESATPDLMEDQYEGSAIDSVTDALMYRFPGAEIT